jgi:hypothetical protein
VKSYLERQVRERFADANDWQFVANIDTSCPYDVSVETKLMADKFGLDHPAEME